MLAAILAYGALVATLSSTIPSCRQANAQLVDYGWHTQAISPSLGPARMASTADRMLPYAVMKIQPICGRRSRSCRKSSTPLMSGSTPIV